MLLLPPLQLTSFNTQPPEGGWTNTVTTAATIARFNTQPPEGGWGSKGNGCDENGEVSTHSRPKAAGLLLERGSLIEGVSTHSRPKAAGLTELDAPRFEMGFNTQPPEGGWFIRCVAIIKMASCFNTQPPEGGWHIFFPCLKPIRGFNTQPPEGGWR